MLSVIIPTRNRSDLLKLALQSLQSQTLSADSFEVLVIDNGSTDNTKQVVTSTHQQLDNMRYFFDPTPGLHVGRHLGMKMAKSDILVYADDDIEAFPTWLEGIAESFQDKDVALVGGKNLPKFESEPPDWILKMWEKDKNGNRILGYLSNLDLGDEKKEINPYHVFGCNFSIRKTVLLEAGGFHPDAMPQELIKYRGDGESHVSQYILERGYKAFYNPKASVYHRVSSNRLTEVYFCQRAYNQGISDSYTRIRKGDCKQTLSLVLWLSIIKYSTLFLFYRIIEYKIRCSYYRGYIYHQRESKKEQNLIGWIKKQKYF